MTVDIKKTDAEELSFLDIVRRDGNIKIPLIQRDYAQGRPSKKITSIREKFIKDIYNCIINKTRLNLDFVYGATNGKRFIPLDGQQRLTTLFLLHLYLDGLRGEQNEKLNFFFTYETDITHLAPKRRIGLLANFSLLFFSLLRSPKLVYLSG